jgi:hypothetical protein
LSCSSLSFGKARESISNDIVFAGKVDNVGTVFLNNQSPVSEMIGSED